MSYWSSMNLVRVGAPPVVTASAIGRFVSDLAATGAFAVHKELLCQIKYGPRVDADEKTTDAVDSDESGYIATSGEYPWDRSETFSSPAALTEALLTDNRTVYRAWIRLGMLASEIVTTLTRDPCEDNEVGLCLSDLSFSVEPEIVSGLGSEIPALVGWMGLSLSGYGYFFPWDFRQGRERAESVELVQRLVATCRATWPVPPGPVSAEAVVARQKAPDLWLYDDFALPSDWLWFASES